MILLWFRQLIVYGYKSRETVPEVQMPQHRIEVRFTRIHSIDNADGVQCYSPLYFAVTTPTGIRFEVVWWVIQRPIAFWFCFWGFGAQPWVQSRRASGVYTGLPVFWHRRSDSFEETTKCAFEAFEFVLDVFVLGDRGSRNTKPAYQDGSQWRTIPHIKMGSLQAVKSRFAFALDRFPFLKTWPWYDVEFHHLYWPRF